MSFHLKCPIQDFHSTQNHNSNFKNLLNSMPMSLTPPSIILKLQQCSGGSEGRILAEYCYKT